MRTRFKIGLLMMVINVSGSCNTPKEPVKSVAVYGKENDKTFDGVPLNVVEAVKNVFKERMNDAPEDTIPSSFEGVKKEAIHIGIPYEIYLIKAEAMEKEEVPDLDDLKLDGFDVPIIDGAGKEHITFNTWMKSDGVIHASSFMGGGAYGYTKFLTEQKCGETGRRIVVRRVPRSGYPRAYKYVGCLGPEQTLESGRYWQLYDIGNQLDEHEQKEYTWPQVFKKLKVYYKELKDRGVERKWQ